jgi:mRNA-degrading endonuclease toxin of MazEF toxin-antitoxin module
VPAPQGTIIDLPFLWKHEADAGRVEGSKDHPCVVIASAQDMALVVPISSQPVPIASKPYAVEIPPAIARQIALPRMNSVVLCDHANIIDWPTPFARSTMTRRITGALLGEILETYRKARADRVVSTARLLEE